MIPSAIGELINLCDKWEVIFDEYYSAVETLNYDVNLVNYPNTFGYMFSSSSSSRTTYNKYLGKIFTNTDGAEYDGQLDNNLFSIYGREAQDLLLLNSYNNSYFYTDVDDSQLTNDRNKIWVFELRGRDENVLGYCLLKWPSSESQPIIQVLINDVNQIKPFESEALTPAKENLKNTNIYQCINQQNFLYAWGEKYPLKTKLLRPDPNQNLIQLFIKALNVNDAGFEKYRLQVKTDFQHLDLKISVPKDQLRSGTTTASYIDIENFKLDVADRKQKQSLDIFSRDEKHRIMAQTMANRTEDLNFENIMGGTRIAANTISGYAASAQQLTLNPFAAVSGAISTTFNIGMETAQHVENMRRGYRDLKQTDAANANTIFYEKNTMDIRHKYEERKEKLKILEMSSNITQWNATDAEEIKAFSEVIFGDKSIIFGLIIHRPSEDGILMKYITSFYERYGVDIFVTDYKLNFDEFIKTDLQIWQFDTITDINIDDFKHKEIIRNIFLNGVRFVKTDYIFEEPAHLVEAKEERKRLIEEAKANREKMLRLIAEEKAKIALEVDKYKARIGQLEQDIADKVVLIAGKEGQIAADKEKLDQCVLDQEQLEQTKKDLKTNQASVTQLQTQLEEEKSAHKVASQTVTSMTEAAQIHSEQMQALEKELEKTKMEKNTAERAWLNVNTKYEQEQQKTTALTRELNECKSKTPECEADSPRGILQRTLNENRNLKAEKKRMVNKSDVATKLKNLLESDVTLPGTNTWNSLITYIKTLDPTWTPPTTGTIVFEDDFN